MHPDVVAALRCPLEGGDLALDGRTLVCDAGHRFDLARQGYVNLLPGRDPGTADGAAMVAARESVLGSGRFAPVTAAVADLVADHLPPGGVVVDLGAGTGHHLAGVLDRLPERIGVAVDLSKHAARRAARRHPRMGSVVADVWQAVPVRTGAAAAVLSVFAPRNGAEAARLLRPDGAVVVATPARHHLGELVGPLGLLEVDPRKPERLAATLGAAFVERAPLRAVEASWHLDHEEVLAIVGMGPSADHLDAAELARRVAALPEPVTVTAAVELRTFGRR